MQVIEQTKNRNLRYLMGIRNLTCVVINKEYKVAQYGHFDGQPEGQGIIILDFINNKENIERLKESLVRCRFMNPRGVDKKIVEGYKEIPPDQENLKQTKWFNTFISINIAGKILRNIINCTDREILLKDSIDFAMPQDGFNCEWCYVVDLDKNTFEVYSGYQKGAGDRFYSDKRSSLGFGPVRLVKEFDLNNLPTKEEFLKDMEELCE